MPNLVEQLVNSEDPTERYKARMLLLSEDPRSNRILKLQDEIRSSDRVKTLLSERRANGEIPWHPYAKWDGAHWILASLADLGYPENDKTLIPLREQVYNWLLSNEHQRHTEARPYLHKLTPSQTNLVKERPRIHASMEGNAIWYLLTLDLFDKKAQPFVKRLLQTQWPDGGWNCDGNPEATNSSFMETILPLRALSLHSRLKRSSTSKAAARRAAEIFLKRKLYKRAKTGSTINTEFVKLHYPLYWHYDILHGLKVMAEAGLIKDSRCKDALDLLETKSLKNGGFSAESKYYRVTKSRGGRSLVGWGSVGPKTMNEFVTLDVLYVLKEAGRWKP